MTHRSKSERLNFIDMMQQTTGRCDDDIWVVAQICELGLHGISPDERRDAQIRKLGQLFRKLERLQRQLARGCQYHAPRASFQAMRPEFTQHWYQKRRRFPAPRARHGDDVPSLQRRRYCLSLNRRRHAITLALDGSKHIW